MLSNLLRTKKMKEDNPTELKIMHITIIWYLTEINGDTPDKICPVIIPGRVTKPVVVIDAKMGAKDFCIADWI